MKFMGRAGQSNNNIGKKDESQSEDENKVEKMIGYTKTKRKIAIRMGFDPYSTNAVLQKQLDEIARASWEGGFTSSAAALQTCDTVVAALTGTHASDSVD